MKTEEEIAIETALAAGVAAMSGEFMTDCVYRAIAPWMPKHVIPPVWDFDSYVAECAHRLLERERKAGRIMPMGGTMWRAVIDWRDLAQRMAVELERQLDNNFDGEIDGPAVDLIEEAKAAGLEVSP